GYTLVAAVVWLALAFLIVLGPLILTRARRYMPLLEPTDVYLTFLRYGIAALALVIALFLLHKWLPAGRRSLLDILPGIVVTIIGSLLAGIMFGQYLQRFAENYISTYAGLASVMIALVFLYFISCIFVYGGEFNAAIMKTRLPRQRETQRARPSPAPAPASAERRASG
ncbi:MAG: YhjD/YihY/BrkB family envelope integrity protein, partial [Tardiphaga sp.]